MEIVPCSTISRDIVKLRDAALLYEMPSNLREKTSSEKYTDISLRIQWKISAEGNAFRKCQQIILPLIIIFRGQNLS